MTESFLHIDFSSCKEKPNQLSKDSSKPAAPQVQPPEESRCVLIIQRFKQPKELKGNQYNGLKDRCFSGGLQDCVKKIWKII